jgi:hypothetical protein
MDINDDAFQSYGDWAIWFLSYQADIWGTCQAPLLFIMEKL